MSFELIIRPEAEADVLEAFQWYNEQLSGLGQQFLDEFEKALDSIRANPEANRRVHRELRRVLTRRQRTLAVGLTRNDALERRTGHPPA